ncbi:MAG: peptidoglycan recognition family protein [Candidatus Woesearchaeota archaeon]|jgi:N-acetyl-anhydromuramyl-L-alanine amidase AmpD
MRLFILSSKKGSVFFTLLFSLLIFSAVFVIFISSKSAADLLKGEKEIGKKQLELLRTYQKGENILFYLDESAKLSLKNATDILAKNGGFYSDSKNIIGAPLWYYHGEDLRPTNYENNFEDAFSAQLRAYTSRYSILPSYFTLFIQNKYPLSVYGSSENDVEYTYSSEFNYEQEISSGAYDNKRNPGLIQFSRIRTKSVDRIVLHHTGGSGTADDVIKVLINRGLSIHYIIEQNGNVVSVLPENKVAFHAGCVASDNKCILPDMNSRSIGIEIINTAHFNDKFDEQYENIEKLLRDICERYDIPYDDEHIIGHYEITTNKWDPAPQFDWSKIDLSNHPTQETLARGCPLTKDWGGVCWT